MSSELIDFDRVCGTKPLKRNKGQIPFTRYLISGSSGSGKTSLLLSMLMNKRIRPEYEKIVLICPSASEPKYQWLEKTMREYEEENDIEQGEAFEWYRDRVPSLDELELPKDGNTVLVYDDLVSAPKQDTQNIVDAFIRGRHKRCMAVYLSQSFYRTPKVIRSNCTCFLYTSLNGHDCSMIRRDFAPELKQEEFQGLLTKAFKTDENSGLRGFLVIDTLGGTKEQRFRTTLSPDA